MSKTAQLMLPLVMPAQAQKHVIVNQAFAILDALTQLTVESASTLLPPAASIDGAAYLVPSGASGVWHGRGNSIAVWSNGDWQFLTPRPGWRAWDQERAVWRNFDGRDWVANAIAVSPEGAWISARVIEFDHIFDAGATNTTSTQIPAGTQVLGLSGRVVEAITGTGLSGWRVGVSGADNRYGHGLGKDFNSYLVGLSSAPVTYYSDTSLVLTAEGGSFAGGVVRLAIHLLEIAPPRMI